MERWRTGRATRVCLGVRRNIVLLCATATAWMMASPGQACEAPEGPPTLALERCLLLEQGTRANLEGQYDEADATWQALRKLDPSDPAPEIWSAETGLWRLILDPKATQNDARVEAASKRAIELADARLKLDPSDAQAMSQKGMALMIQARLNGMRGRYLKAGRAGEQSRVLLEKSLALDPSQEQGRYPLAVYYYYAGIAPSFLKWVSWLWFVPKGDREKGLGLMREVRDGPGLRSDEARFMLMIIDNYHSPGDQDSALVSGRFLHDRYPDNPLFHSELIEVMVKRGDYEEAIATALVLEQSQPAQAEAVGRPMLARILRAQATLLSGNEAEAWRILQSMDEKTTPLPVWGGAWLHLVRGQVLDARGERDAALAEYRRVQSLEGLAYNERAAIIAESALEVPFVPSDYRELPMVGAGPPSKE